MIFLYGRPDCNSCKKAKALLEANQIDFEERDFFEDGLSMAELTELLAFAQENQESIFSTRFIVSSRLTIDFDQMATAELLAMVQEYPRILKRPIIVSSQGCCIGYNEQAILSFLAKVQE